MLADIVAEFNGFGWVCGQGEKGDEGAVRPKKLTFCWA